MTSSRISRIKAAALATVLFLLPPAAPAEEIKVTLDPAKTRIEWTLSDVLHTVHGTFKLKSGVILYDPATSMASGAIVVDAASGESGNHTRDSKMHKEILESKKYPEITFFPKHVIGQVVKGSSEVEVQGTMRIHGSDHDLPLRLEIQAIAAQVTATTNFIVPYEAWGLKNPSTLLLRVENKVAISVSSAANIGSSSAAGMAH